MSKLLYQREGNLNVGIGGLLILVSVILFVLVAFGVSVSGVGLLPLGLAFFAAGHLL